MKTGYVIGRFPWPSETFVSREIADLIDLGSEVEIYAFEGPSPGDVELLSGQARELMARTHYISTGEALTALLRTNIFRMLGANGRFSREATGKSNPLLRLGRAAAIVQRAKRDGVGALHAHWPYATQVAHLASLASGLPYSISIHAHEVAHEGGHFPIVFERLRLATFCNAAAMTFLLDKLPSAAREKAHLVYHGVDVDAFPELPPRPPGGALEVISAGRMTRSKGFDRLVRACAEAVRQGVDVRLTILGRGPERDAVEALAAELGFSERLSLPGWVSHERVRDFLADSDVFALLADIDFNDGLPNVAVEAMACGRPVILSPLPAAVEAVKSGETGFVLKSVDDQAGAIAALVELQDRKRALQMGKAARKTMVERYDARIHIRTLAQLLGQVSQ